MVKLSVVLATYNEEKNIKECLLSVQPISNELIVVDGSSLDKTALIAKSLGAKVYSVSNQLMFHKNKQIALEKAKNPWILQLDADERVNRSLQKEITNVLKNENLAVNGYYIPRRNFFLGKVLTKGGQYPDYVMRLVRKNKAYFPCVSVHEQIKVSGKTSCLKSDLIHLSNRNLSHYWQNANRYTSLTAWDLTERNLPINFINNVKYLAWLPIKTFFNIYIRHLGLVDGLPGFLFALFSGWHYPIAYFKYLQHKKETTKNYWQKASK